MSTDQVKITAKEEEVTDDIYSELDEDRCPFCHIDLDPKTEDQWLRSYDGHELWLTDVKSLLCSNCGVQVYPEETLNYFEAARNGELPALKSREYTPESYEDETEE